MAPVPSAPARRLSVVPALALAAGLGACAPIEPGQSGVSAEFNRIQGRDGFAVVASAPTQTVFAAKGQQVVIAPASGFCVAEDSLDISSGAAFALLSDCGSRSNMAASTRAFPGIFTVSVSGGPMVDPGATPAQAIEGLESFVGSRAGLSLLGRGPGASDVEVVATRRLGDGLYVLVEDRGSSPLPILAPRFWRAFVELSGRMSMVTASSFREAPVAEDELLAFLVRQVVALRHANRASPSGDELEMAGRVDQRYLVASADNAPELEVAGSGDGLPEPSAFETAGEAMGDAAEPAEATVAAETVASGQPVPAAGGDAAYAGPKHGQRVTSDPAYLGPGAGDPPYQGSAPAEG